MDKMIKVGGRQRVPCLARGGGSPGRALRPGGARSPLLGLRLYSSLPLRRDAAAFGLRCGAPGTGQGNGSCRQTGFHGIRPRGIGAETLGSRTGAAGSRGLCFTAVPGCGGNAVASVHLRVPVRMLS